MSGVREWDRSTGDPEATADRAAPGGPRTPGDPADAAPARGTGTERLTAGAASVVLAPVTDPDVLRGHVAAITARPGVARVALDAFEDGQAVLTVTVAHPLLLAQEIGRALEGRVRSCTPAGPGGRIVVDARAPLAPPPPVEPDPEPAIDDAEDEDELTMDDAPASSEASRDDDGPGDDGGPDADAPGGTGPADARDAGAAPGTADPSDGPRRPEPGPAPEDPAADREEEDGSRRGRASHGPRRGWGRRGRGARAPETDGGDAAAQGAPGPDAGASAGGSGPSSWGARARGRSADPGDRASAGAGTGAGGAAGRGTGGVDDRVVAAALAGAIDDTPGLSVLVYDAELRVRAAAGLDPEAADGALLIGRPVVHAFALDARRPLAAALTAALQGDERTLTVPDDAGEPRLQATCRPAGPGLPGGVCIVRDLEAQSGGTLLAEAQRAFEITFRHSPIGQGLLSRTGRWLRVNGALAELLGRSEDELVGAEAVDAMHPDDRDGERERLDALVDGPRDHYVVGTRFVHADGHVVRTHTRMTRITDDEGVARGFVAQVVDAAAWRRFRGG